MPSSLLTQLTRLPRFMGFALQWICPKLAPWWPIVCGSMCQKICFYYCPVYYSYDENHLTHYLLLLVWPLNDHPLFELWFFWKGYSFILLYDILSMFISFFLMLPLLLLVLMMKLEITSWKFYTRHFQLMLFQEMTLCSPLRAMICEGVS